jgi:hypothetical protein
MPYIGESLLDLLGTDKTGPPTRRLMRDVADAAGAAMTAAAKQHTPVRTGRTRDSLQQVPVHPVPGGWASGVESSYYKMKWVESGVKAHELRAKKKKALSTPEGPRASAQSPGHAGAHPIAKAAVEVEATLERIARPHVEAWAQEIERKGG